MTTELARLAGDCSYQAEVAAATVEIVAVAWVSGIVAEPETCFEAAYC